MLGDAQNRLPNTANVAFEHLDGEAILHHLNRAGIAASLGSACASGSMEPSHVLRAMNVPQTALRGAIRFSLSRDNTTDDVDRRAAGTAGDHCRAEGVVTFVAPTCARHGEFIPIHGVDLMKIMIRRSPETGLSIYVPKKDLEEPIVESEHETLWGGWIRIANGWVLDLPEMAADTRLPITVNARKRGGGGMSDERARSSTRTFCKPPDAEALARPISPRGCAPATIIPYLGPGLAELSKPDGADDAGGARGLLRNQGGAAAPRQGQCLGCRAAYRKLQASLHGDGADDGGVRHAGRADAACTSYLASLPLPMIVDAWYDGAMRTALAQRSDWGEIQGITRAGIGEDRWYRFYDAAGAEATRADAEGWKTILYKPHGGIAPAKNFLISDADYVEVLTEIDIQTPIPDVVKDRRTERSFLFMGCRFHDQLLRTYARQITQALGRAALCGGRAGNADAERTAVSSRAGANRRSPLPLTRVSEMLIARLRVPASAPATRKGAACGSLRRSGRPKTQRCRLCNRFENVPNSLCASRQAASATL